MKLQDIWPFGTWRIARKNHHCDYIKNGGIVCREIISIGEKYFDPGESNPDCAGGFGGYHFCFRHDQNELT